MKFPRPTTKVGDCIAIIRRRDCAAGLAGEPMLKEIMRGNTRAAGFKNALGHRHTPEMKKKISESLKAHNERKRALIAAFIGP